MSHIAAGLGLPWWQPGKQEHHPVQQARQKPVEQSQAELGSAGQLPQSGLGPLKTAE